MQPALGMSRTKIQGQILQIMWIFLNQPLTLAEIVGNNSGCMPVLLLSCIMSNVKMRIRAAEHLSCIPFVRTWTILGVIIILMERPKPL